MANPVEAERYIRFQLEHLSDSNEHHTFEQVCLRIAQRRISSNVIPATGPVSAGGDQGRDAETYYTTLPEELPGAGGFIGRATTKPVVIACTIQKDRLADKVRADLKTICADGPKPARVAYFTVHEIPVAVRHRLQKHAERQYGVSLEIFDGLAIANLLAQGDLVWVAQRYLDLPSEMLPDNPEDPKPEWYMHTLNVLRDRSEPRLTLGAFSEVRDGLRHAVGEPEANPDLPEWIGYMWEFVRPSPESELAMRARYEIVVATYKCTNTLDRLEDDIRAVLEYAVSSDIPSIVDDASALLMFWGGAHSRHIGTVEAAELEHWNSLLRGHARSLLDATDRATASNRRARLLSTLAFLCLQPHWGEMGRPDPGTLPPPTETTALLRAMEAAGEEPTVDSDSQFFDLSEVMQTLSELAELLPDAPVFGLGGISKVFQFFAPALVADSRYERVRDALDNAAAAVSGDSEVAERSRMRAAAFRRAGRPLEALREFHNVKAKWWHGDTLRGSVMAMRVIGRIYQDLGLTFAAKQYALAAALVASHEDDLRGLAPDALIEAMGYTYVAGNWADALGIARVAANAHALLAEDAFDEELHPALENLDFNSAMILLAAEHLRPELLPMLRDFLGDDVYEARVKTLVDTGRPTWMQSGEELVELADKQLCGRPFSDIGPRRTMSFAALGTTWFVRCINNRRSVLAAERFVAAAQILLADLALEDPELLPQDVIVEVLVGTPLQGNDRVRIKPNNNAVECAVFLSPHVPGADLQELAVETTTVLFELVARLTTRPQSEVSTLLERAFAGGLLHKMNAVRPYDEAADLLPESHYQQVAAVALDPLKSSPFRPHAATDLASPTTPGRGYDQEKSLKLITENYQYLPTLLNQTLPRALQDPATVSGLQELRDEGWLDWQLLLAMANAALNVRLREAGGLRSFAPPTQKERELVNTPETGSSTPIPLRELSAEALRQWFGTALFAVAKRRWGVEPTVETPNGRALRDLLIARYGLLTDDVPHRDLLGQVLDEAGRVVPLVEVNEADAE